MNYNYYAKVNRVIDGDTVNMTIDLGFNIYTTTNCRLAFINAYELKDKDDTKKAKAYEAKDYLTFLLTKDLKVEIISHDLDKYGRPIVEIFITGRSINHDLLDKGLALPYQN